MIENQHPIERVAVQDPMTRCRQNHRDRRKHRPGFHAFFDRLPDEIPSLDQSTTGVPGALRADVRNCRIAAIGRGDGAGTIAIGD